jgi:putative heme-binding domain-containing protein
MNKSLRLAFSLAAILATSSLPAADSLPQLVRLLGSSNDTQLQLDLLRGLSQAMEGRPQVPMPAGWDAVEPALARSGNGEIRSLTQALGLKFGSPAALAALKQTLRNPQADTGERRNALRALLTVRDPEMLALLQALVRDSALSADAVRGLAAFGDEKTPGAILSAYATLSDEAKRDAVNTLASRPAFARPLLAAVEQGTVPKQALTADLLRQLRSLNDADVLAGLEKVYGTFRESTADKQQQINKFKTVYFAGGSTPGDAPRGRVVYDRICAQCHTLFDVGGKVGPDLTGSARTDLDYILQNMVDPNAVIPNEYRTSTIEMKDDRVITGIVKSQDQNAVTIATANETLVLPRKDIAEIIQSELSMMPEGLLDTLTDQEVRDLIYYLRQPAQASLPAQ